MKEQKRDNNKASSKPQLPKSTTGKLDLLARQQIHLATVIQRARLEPHPSLTPRDILQLQQQVGNQAISKLLPGERLSPVMHTHQTKPGSAAISFDAGADFDHELTPVAQQSADGIIRRKIEKNKLNVVGENHRESHNRRDSEKAMLKEKYEFSENKYWTENELNYSVEGETRYGDDLWLLVAQSASMLLDRILWLKDEVDDAIFDWVDNQVIESMEDIYEEVKQLDIAVASLADSPQGQKYKALIAQAKNIVKDLPKKVDHYALDIEEEDLPKHLGELLESIKVWKIPVTEMLKRMNYNPIDKPQELTDQIKESRSLYMYMAGEESNETGVWKVGEGHVQDMKGLASDKTSLTTREEFNTEYEAWEESR